MDLHDAIHNRRSIRCFLPDSVPEETIKEILKTCLWAPSWGNTQPWEIIVVTGEALKHFKEKNREALLQGQTSFPDIPMPKVWPDALKKRYTELGKRILESLNIDREDTEGRIEYYAQMYYLFDAPALILFVIDDELSLEYAMLEVGIFLQTFCLLACSKGLGTCIFAGTVHCPEIVHRHFDILENKHLVLGAALGWPDTTAPVNNFERQRGDLEEFVRWIR